MPAYPEPDHTGPDGPDRIEWWTWPHLAVGVTTYVRKDGDAPTAGTSWKCARCGAVITAEEYDYDLREYRVHTARGRYVATHTPHNLRAQAEDVARLDAGECPLCDGWEDGEGGTYADLLHI